MKKLIAIAMVVVLTMSIALVPAANVGAAPTSYTLLETLSVPAQNVPLVTSTSTLLSSRNFRFEVSGTYSAGAGITADAEYSSGPDSYVWQDLVEKYEGYGEGLLELMVDGSIVEWGNYSSSHVYTLDYPGTGSTVSFQIYDLGGGTNNSGSLTVKIYVANKVINVPTDYSTIQAAVDAAFPGDTIKVHGGSYTEQVTITTSNLMVKGVGSPIITVSSETTGPIVHVWNATSVSIVGFEIDGACNGLSTTPSSGGPATDQRFYGIRYSDASGKVQDNQVHGIEHPAGCKGFQSGVAIYAYASNVCISGNTVHDYQKCGIVANLAGNSQIHDNTVTGWGSTTLIAQNGIQVGYGACASVKNNTVTDNLYSTTSWAASGILLFEADNNSVTRNMVDANGMGVAIETWGYLQVSADNNKVTNNTITNSDVGVSIAAYYGGTADNNKVIHNKFKGNATDISDLGTGTKIHANVP